jgi:rhombotail lipoprotein
MRNTALALLLSAGLAGCAGTQTKHTSSSVVDYLYPNSEPVIAPAVPVLNLPLRVGIAFVPPQRAAASSFALTEKRKNDVLNQVASHFKDLPFVTSIEVIPSPYIRPQGGFANLEQIRTMYGVDVVALVSYDQTQFTDQGFLTLTYWTIIGAYVVRGEKNDTHTMLDTVVYDISSRKLLFRAPGLSQIRGSATPVNLSEQLRADSEAGINTATADMITNLDAELAAFREKVKQRPQEYRVVQTSGYRGGGMDDGLLLALSLALFGAGWWARRRK